MDYSFNRICKKAFVHFCSENDINYEKVIKSYSKRRPYNKIGEYRNIIKIFDMALCWDETEEGWDFWYNVQLKWTSTLVYVINCAYSMGLCTSEDVSEAIDYYERLVDFSCDMSKIAGYIDDLHKYC